MNVLGRVSVLPTLPERIARLEELAYNLWWSWTPEAQNLWIEIDPLLWQEVYHNPVKFLRRVAQEKLDQAAQSPHFLDQYDAVLASFDHYMAREDTWFQREFPEHVQNDILIAYFSAEFGLHESLPIYSGGLGVLSGDHCKAASDLNLPFVGVGFLYPQGYFQQRISSDGVQEAVYNKLDLNEVPARPARDEADNPIMVSVELPGRTVSAQVWTIQVGRVTLLMLDTDVDPNAPEDRDLAARLYGGDQEMRISQEIILGIGGVRALEKMGYNPTVWHMNEGHSAFLGLERVRRLVQDHGLSFHEAVEAVRAGTLFTTHTPVPAGNDAFTFELVERYFYNYWPRLGVSRDEFLSLARHDMPWGPRFSMTVLALRLSGRANGVSELHGSVSRDMWKDLWPDIPTEEVPITHVTNGVHHQTWVGPEMESLLDRYLSTSWRNELASVETWSRAREIPDAELASARKVMKSRLVAFVRERTAAHYQRLGMGPARVREAEKLLDPNVLTIGFARRFATYKRAMLIFRDMERLKRILNNPERPVQILFSGKAHPADEPGKALIRQIFHIAAYDPDLRDRILFIEDYDMNVARHLVAGVDVWLNNPRRPLEASGTSGEKAAMNGAPNFSVLDGWWREAWNGRNGWAIGEERSYASEQEQDEEDAISLYTTLEEQIVPLYYSEGAPPGESSEWLAVVKESIATITPRFSMQRMVQDYTTQLYVPAEESGASMRNEGYRNARSLAGWKDHIRARWEGVRIEAEKTGDMHAAVGHSIPLRANVYLNGLSPHDVSVEIVTGTEADHDLRAIAVHPMTLKEEVGDNVFRYEGAFKPARSGQQAYGIRVLPANGQLINPVEVGKVRWA